MSSATYLAPGVYVEEVPSARQPIAGVGTNVAGFIGIVPKRLYIPVPNPDYDPVVARATRELTELIERRAQLERRGPLDDAVRQRLEMEQALAATAQQNALRAKEDDLNAEKQKKEQADARVTQTETELTAATQKANDARQALDAATGDAKPQARAESNAATHARSAAEQSHRSALDEQERLRQSIEDMTNALDAARAAATPPDAPAPVVDPARAGGGAPVGGAAPEGTDQSKLVEKEPDDMQPMDWDPALLAPSFLRPYILKEFELTVDPLETKFCTNFTEYAKRFGAFSAYKEDPDVPYPNPDKWLFSPYYPGHHALTHAVDGFFRNGGTKAYIARIESEDQLEDALKKFKSIDDLAIIAAPGLPRNSNTWESLMSHVENRENCFAILDAPGVVNDGDDEDLDVERMSYSNVSSVLPRPCKNAAFYFPHIEVVDPAKQLQDSDPRRKVGPKYRGRTYVAPSGHIAGIYARTDSERGVHKAPANCVVRGAVEVKYYISKPIQEELNPQGVNAIRIMDNAVTVWGARTIGGDANSEWKYVSVRRLFLFLQKSIELGTQWIVFEPNDEALWGKIRLNITAFLTNVWRTGALFGATPEQAFYVKCDAELNPPEVRDVGQVITEIGVAIVRPAEFVIFRITQSTGIGQS